MISADEARDLVRKKILDGEKSIIQEIEKSIKYSIDQRCSSCKFDLSEHTYDISIINSIIKILENHGYKVKRTTGTHYNEWYDLLEISWAENFISTSGQKEV